MEEFFCRIFWGGICFGGTFLEEFFGEDFFERIFWEDFFERNFWEEFFVYVVKVI